MKKSIPKREHSTAANGDGRLPAARLRTDTAGPATGTALPAAGRYGMLWRLLLALLSGTLLFLSFPDYDIYPLGWICLVPLFAALENVHGFKAFLLGSVVGLTATVGGFYWIVGLLMDFGHMSPASAIPIFCVGAALLGTQYGLFALFTQRLQRRTGLALAVVAPIVFVVCEFLFPLLFPWYLGNGQYRFHVATQISDITGVLGVSALLVLVNATLWLAGRALLRRQRVPWRLVWITAALSAVILVYGFIRIWQIDEEMAQAPRERIGLVEANIGIWEKEAGSLPVEQQIPTLQHNLLLHQQMSADLERQGVDLIVWPESSYYPVMESWAKVTPHFALGVGDQGSMAVLRHQQWLLQGQPVPADLQWPLAVQPNLRAVAAVHEEDAYAVGDAGTLLRFDGHRWTAEAIQPKVDLLSVWANPLAAQPWLGEKLTVVAGGRSGHLFERRNGRWTTVQLPTTGDIVALAGPDGAHLHAFARDGSRFICDGITWRPANLAAPFAARAAWSPADGKIWIVGDQGQIAQWEGQQWQLQQTGTLADLSAIWGDSQAGTVLCAGKSGTLLRYQAKRWQRIETKTTDDLLAIAGDGRHGWVIASADGALLHCPSGATAPSRINLPANRTIRALATLDFRMYYPLPHDVTYVYVSPVPLPQRRNYPEDVAADQTTASRDRNAIQRGFTTPILLGAVTQGPKDPAQPHGEQAVYNTAMLVESDGRVTGLYDKVYLLLFGEYIPLGETFPVLYEWLPEAGHFTPGREVRTFPFKNHRMGIMVCYEDILPRFTARLADQNPNIIMNVTNDAWFGKTAEPLQHLALASFRAIENRLYLVRSTNTGISAYVDAVGRIQDATDLDTAETRIRAVPMLTSNTFYRQFGDVFAYLNMAAWAAMALWSWRKARRRRPA